MAAKKTTRTLALVKISGELHGVWKDENGEIVGEEVLARIDIYKPDLPRAAKIVEEAWPRIAKAREGG
jgi:hypothetical protein